MCHLFLLSHNFLLICLTADPHVKVGGSLLTTFITVTDSNKVMAGFLVTVGGNSIALRIVTFAVAVGLDGNRRAAVAEVPGLTPGHIAECPNLEGNLVTRLDAEGGVIGGMNSGRQLIGMVFVDNLDNGKVIVGSAGSVGNPEDLAVSAGLVVSSLNFCADSG